MNMYFFGLKRAYYGTLVRSRRPLARMGMTAARFDLITAIGEKGWIGQQTLRLILGVCAATLTEMLQALEKLKWIERERLDDDLRYKKVRLTTQGMEKLREVNKWIDKDHASLDPITTPDARIPGRNGAYRDFFEPHVSNFRAWLVWMIRAFDYLGPHPPWDPDD